MRFDELHLWYLEQPQQPRYVGVLRLIASGKGVSLRYGADWLSRGFALSEDLPLIEREHLPPMRLVAETERAAGAVDDARPDRWGEKVIRHLDRPRRLSIMEYLYYAGDERFGALGISTSADTYQPRAGGPLPRLAQVADLAEVVAKIEAGEPISELEAKIVRGGGSLGGAKPKALIEIGGEQWVIKFFNGEPIDTPLIEHASMRLAARAGIVVADTQVLALAGAHAIAVRRFDRKQDIRLHSISAGTALRAVAGNGSPLEMGYPELARILRRIGVSEEGRNRTDSRELFRRMVFNILIDNTDDHEKNHSLLVVNPEHNGRLRLAPAYDVVPTNSGQGHQEFVCGAQGHDSTLENAMSQCEAFGLTTREAAAEITAVITVVEGWQAHFQATGVSARDIENLAQRIDGDLLLRERRDFTATRFSTAPVRRKRSSPFRRA